MSYDLNQALRLARWYVEREIPPGHPDEALVNLSGALIGSVDLLGRQTVSDRDLEEQYGTLRKAAEDLYLSVVGPARIIGPFEYVRPDALIALRDALQASTPASSPRSDRPSSGSLDGND